jgi:hydrogenase/urease accessory protein HupE
MRRSFVLRPARWAALLAFVFLAFPAVASAHGLSIDDDPNRPLAQYVVLGFKHMATGWDHLLFILGCVLLAPSVRSAAKLVSLFVLGHSLTLLLATLAGSKVNVTAVDVAIALSVVFVGALGVWRGEKNWRLVGAVVFGFGLVHGLGLSTRLQEIALPEDGLATRIVLFNVGIELGQLAVLAVVVGVWRLLPRFLARPATSERVAFGGLVAAGLIAAVILPFTASTETAVATNACTEADYRPTTTAGSGGGHPPKRFFVPSEPAPSEDMGHVLFDGWIVITYKASLPAADRTALQTWIEGRDQAVVAAAATAQEEVLSARTIRRSLTCTSLDLASLTRFRDAWFGS